MSKESSVLPERLNAEPPIFKSCTSTELITLAIGALVVWIPLGALLAWLLGALPMMLGIAGIGTVVSVLVAASVLQRLKRNRPEGYYQLKVHVCLHDHGLKRSPFIRRSGYWDLGRRREPLPFRD